VPPLRRSPRLRLLALRSRRHIQPAVRRDASTLTEQDVPLLPVWPAPCLAVPAGWPDRAARPAPSRADLQVQPDRKVLQAPSRADLQVQPDPRAPQERSPAGRAGSLDPVAQPVAYPAWDAAASQRPSSRFDYGP
jgi:hypothetical protein